jgi:hypothetical protein
MIGALVYLQITTLKNALRARFQRLRQPKYFFAALVGAAYFYFFFFRRVAENHRPPHGNPLPLAPSDWVGLLEPVAALLLFIAIALAWILPNSRAALAFTEAEVAFLFPAPVPRRTLVHFKLIKSQLGILFSSVLLTLISNRWTFLGGNPWMHAAGWWLIFSVFNLHRIGASFARERLLELGLNVRSRRIVGVGILVVLGLVTWFCLKWTLPAPGDNEFDTPSSLFGYAKTILATPPLSWVLFPFRLVVRPFLAANSMALLSALWPVVLLLAAHYFWVVRSDVAFEEASVALSQKRAERLAAMRSGKWTNRTPTKKRPEPFALTIGGAPSIAFLWKSLIAAGPFYYPKNWLRFGVVLVAALLWFGHKPMVQTAMPVVIGTCVALCVYGVLFGPMLMRRGAGQLLERFDLLKSYPVMGWQAVLGELLCPVMILCVFEWVFLAVLALAIGLWKEDATFTPLVLGSGAVSAGMLVVPLAGLLFALNFAGILYFPAWLSGSAQQGPGIEKVGQRLIFFAGYLIVFVIALLPASVFAALPFLAVRWLLHNLALEIALGALTGCAVLVGEFALVLWWLGNRFEQFDLSVEMPR